MRPDGHRLGAEVHALHGSAVGVDQVAVRRRHEAVVDVQLDVLRAALDEAVDVEEARGDGDRALRQDARAGGVDGGLQVDAVDVGRVGIGRLLVIAVRIEDHGAQHVVVDELLRILAGVEPVLAVEGEVLRRVDVDRVAGHLAGNRDAALEVLDRDRAGLVHHVAQEVQVLVEVRHLGHHALRQGAEIVLVRGADLLLDDGDGLVRRVGAHAGLARLVEVHVARLEHRVLPVDDLDRLRVLDHRVVHVHGERRVVDDVDPGARACEHVGIAAAVVDVRIERVGVDEHGARRRVHVGHLHEQHVEVLAHDGDRRSVDARAALDQAESRQRLVDQVELHLVARHRIGVRRVAGDPRQHLLALLEQHVADVLVDHRRRVDLDRLDDVVLAVQVVAQRLRDVALVDEDVIRVHRLAVGVERGVTRRVAVGAEVAPARGVAVVLALQHDVDAGLQDRLELVVVAVGEVVDDRAGADVERNGAQVEQAVLIGNVGVEPERRLLIRVEVGMARTDQGRALRRGRRRAGLVGQVIGAAAEVERLDVHQRLVVDARLERRAWVDVHLVEGVNRRIVVDRYAVRDKRERQHVAGLAAALVAADARHIAQRRVL